LANSNERPAKAEVLLDPRAPVIVLSIRGFDEDRCMLRGVALTFYSLISIVPNLAMVFGIAKGFGFDKVWKSASGSSFKVRKR
jgi:uncharacterized BrkB/YihY/UPF0761 family membrane protein